MFKTIQLNARLCCKVFALYNLFKNLNFTTKILIIKKANHV